MPLLMNLLIIGLRPGGMSVNSDKSKSQILLVLMFGDGVAVIDSKCGAKPSLVINARLCLAQICVVHQLLLVHYGA